MTKAIEIFKISVYFRTNENNPKATKTEQNVGTIYPTIILVLTG